MDAPEIDLSIIVPAYKTAAYIERCIVSLCEQNYDPAEFEVIVVDDESPDRLCDVVQRLQKRYANLKYIWETNGRQGKARNTGVRHAQGRYIAFVDSDDCWLSRDVISTLIPLCDDNNLDILQSSSYTGIAADADLEMDHISCSDVEIFQREQYLQQEVNHYSAVFSIYNADVIRKIPFREGGYFEDLDFTYKSIWTVGSEGRIGKIDFPYYGYRANPLSVTRAPSRAYFQGNVDAVFEIERFLQECNDMDQKTKYICWGRVRNNVIGWIKLSRLFPVCDSLKVFKYIKKNSVFLQIYKQAPLGWTRICLFCMRWFSLPLIVIVRALVLLKRSMALNFK